MAGLMNKTITLSVTDTEDSGGRFIALIISFKSPDEDTGRDIYTETRTYGVQKGIVSCEVSYNSNYH